ncbi:MAG: hypothetical protein M3Y19_03935 [Actinomycetota bacterium]|nr:hypothetical protein [Actinomycetota bacterium]
MSADHDDVAAYFAEVFERRQAAVSAAIGKIAQARAAGDRALAEIARQAQETVHDAATAMDNATTQASGAWPAAHESEDRFLQAIGERDEAADGSDRGDWSR